MGKANNLAGLRNAVDAANGTEGKLPPSGEGHGLEVDGSSAVLTMRSTTIRTLEGALKEANVDSALWTVSHYVVNKWDQGQKRREGGALVVELWQVKVWLERIASEAVTDGMRELAERLTARAPDRPGEKRSRRKHGIVVVFGMYDHHFGKLAWGAETGTDYDTDIAAEQYLGAIDDLCVSLKPYRICRIELPIGQDFFQANNWLGTTAKGTVVDVDGRFQRVFVLGGETIVRAIDRLSTIAPVSVRWVPGNHDPETSWYLTEFMRAWYRRSKRVTVDASPRSRKYIHHGATLIGLTHGCEIKSTRLPGVMAGEEPQLWAQSSCRVWMIGHRHKKGEVVYPANDTIDGVMVVSLPSLSGTDSWHYQKGFVNSPRAAEAWLYDDVDGYVGHLSVNVRRESNAD